ncbi:MAG TPA: FdtA/QdtA family cupin domain-containing protein [Candidatus Saccharimonadales bacterium]|nr:FdtA/QdtA family cupin domain-containing protein [Candidatus Saccharimonadales bacterium]
MFKKVTLDTKTTDKFVISIAELKDYIPFEVKRVYYLCDIKQPTSQHCHMIEEEFFVQVAGTSTAVIDKGEGREDISLSAGEGIYVPSFVWHGFKNTSSDAIILALSSTNYSPDRSDYLEDYDAYLKIRDEKLKSS